MVWSVSFFFFLGGGGGREGGELTIHESRSFPSGETEALTRGAPLGLVGWRVVNLFCFGALGGRGEQRGELRNGIHGVEDRTHRDGWIFLLFAEEK